MSRWLLTLVCVLAVIPCGVRAGEPSLADAISVQFLGDAQSAVDSNDLPRLSAVVEKDGEIVWAGEFRQSSVLERMWRSQFASTGPRTIGVGFGLGNRHGERAVFHGGATYGQASESIYLPDRRLGVILATNMGTANGVLEHLGKRILDQFVSGAATVRFSPDFDAVPHRGSAVDLTPQRLASDEAIQNDDFESLDWR
ncbi:serine hydrolase [Pacificimonas sp. WHA3]|uniref:Serine hydrolase n=1 Tax=Pacificimonas pallii TaxID=2827236 RepID=A0ABS6SBJ8_9SPHN|nr:serine hydrolase [Pacificimonas pallii]MBV7255301.1 serine hydrolase [Pacificimonas pallii]